MDFKYVPTTVSTSLWSLSDIESEKKNKKLEIVEIHYIFIILNKIEKRNNYQRVFGYL